MLRLSLLAASIVGTSFAAPTDFWMDWVNEVLASNPKSASEFSQMFARRVWSFSYPDGRSCTNTLGATYPVLSMSDNVFQAWLKEEIEGESLARRTVKTIVQNDKDALANMNVSSEQDLSKAIIDTAGKLLPRSHLLTGTTSRRMTEATQKAIKTKCTANNFYECVATLSARELGGDAANAAETLPWHVWEIRNFQDRAKFKPDESDPAQRTRELVRSWMEILTYDVFRGLDRAFIKSLGEPSQARAEAKLAAILFQEVASKHWSELPLRGEGFLASKKIFLAQAKLCNDNVGWASAEDQKALEASWLDSSSGPEDESSFPIWLLVVIIAASVVFVGALVVGIVCCMRKGQQGEN